MAHPLDLPPVLKIGHKKCFRNNVNAEAVHAFFEPLRQRQAEEAQRFKSLNQPKAPKPMSDETKVKLAALRPAPKVQPADSFTLRQLAEELKREARELRAIARANRDKLAPLELAKHTFRNADKSRVIAIMNSKPTGGGKRSKADKPTPAPATPAPKPGDVILASAGKRTRATSQPPKPPHVNVIEKRNAEKAIKPKRLDRAAVINLINDHHAQLGKRKVNAKLPLAKLRAMLKKIEGAI